MCSAVCRAYAPHWGEPDRAEYAEPGLMPRAPRPPSPLVRALVAELRPHLPTAEQIAKELIRLTGGSTVTAAGEAAMKGVDLCRRSPKELESTGPTSELTEMEATTPMSLTPREEELLQRSLQRPKQKRKPK